MFTHVATDRSNGHSKVGASHREVPTGLHAFLVTFLALFFCGLIVWRVPIQGYLVTAEVSVRGGAESAALSSTPGTAAEPGGRQRALIASTGAVDRAIRFADAQVVTRSPGDAVPALHTASAVRKDLHFRDSGGNLGADRIAIHFRGQDREWSVAFVGELVRQFRTAANTPPCHQDDGRAVRQASWEVDGTRHYERKARLDLESDLVAHFERLGAASDAMPSSAKRLAKGDRFNRSARQSSRLVSAEVAESRPDSQRKRMQAELVELTAELSELLKRFTPNHPSVQDATWRIEETRRRLKQLPQFSTASYRHGSLAEQLPPVDLAESGASGATHGQTSGSIMLLEELQSAADLREQAEDKLRDALACRDDAVFPSSLYSESVGESTQEVHTIGGRPSASRVGLIGLMAVVAAALVAQSAGKPSTGGTHATRARVRRRPTSPHFAQQNLRIDDPSQPPKGHEPLIRRHQLRRIAVKASEWFLVLLVVALLVAFLAESPLLPRFASDPFGTLAEAITHTWR